MRQETNWDKYGSNPNSFFSRVFFLNLATRAYADLLKNIEFDRPVDILEFGCGTGFLSRWLVNRYKVNKATLIDLNKKMLDIAEQTLSDVPCEKEFVNKDFFDFETNKKYDIVHSQGVIEHFEDQKRRQLLAKHFKATKTGGYCIVYSPTPTKAYLFFRKLGELLKIWRCTDEVPLEKDIIIKEMESLGFKTLKVNHFWRCYLTEVGILFKKTS